MGYEFAEDAKAFKVFTDENRLRIIKMLYTGERCACVLLEELKISQPTLSHHMKILETNGLVTVRKDGKWSHYTICEKRMKQLKGCFDEYIKINIEN